MTTKTKDNKKATLMGLIAIANPYDESSHSRDTFIEKIQEFPELEIAFQAQYTEEFAESIEKRGIFFITNHVSWKMKRKLKPQVRLSYCGKEESPTISLDF